MCLVVLADVEDFLDGHFHAEVLPVPGERAVDSFPVVFGVGPEGGVYDLAVQAEPSV